MKNNKKKGFTLVELLVVIAILAILATVSILGYTSFTAKAKQSNSDNELAQIKTLFLADWLDGFVGETNAQHSIKKVDGGYEFEYTTAKGAKKTLTAAEVETEVGKFLKENAFGTEEKDITNEMQAFVSFGGTYTIKENEFGTDTKEYSYTITVTLTNVSYNNGNGYPSTWELPNGNPEAVAAKDIVKLAEKK